MPSSSASATPTACVQLLQVAECKRYVQETHTFFGNDYTNSEVEDQERAVRKHLLTKIDAFGEASIGGTAPPHEN